eukprot:9501460-Pyramimonas_sp.AAC.1
MEDPIFVTWHDAAWKVRKAGGSQCRKIVAMAERKILDGHKTALPRDTPKFSERRDPDGHSGQRGSGVRETGLARDADREGDHLSPDQRQPEARGRYPGDGLQGDVRQCGSGVFFGLRMQRPE